MKKTVRTQLLELGMLENELDNYSSDLYILKNEISTNFVNAYEFNQNVTIFKDKIEGKIWYEIPFAYTEKYNIAATKAFKVEFTGREIGSIGAIYKINQVIRCNNIEDVEKELYKNYEHISALKIKE